MNVYAKLAAVQSKLKAPKNQRNNFGKYNYRSCEDILEAVKPILKEEGCALVLSDKITCIDGRFYVEATAAFYDVEDGASAENTAYAREPESKKGMDESQITGTASSYARKYALNGLFAIDDTKDADTDEYRAQAAQNPVQKAQHMGVPTEQEKLVCPVCGKTVNPVKTIDGTVVTPAELLRSYGMCAGCYWAKKTK